MATSTKRRVKRDAAQRVADEQKKASKRNAKLATLDTIKRDSDVKKTFADYEARERGPQSMVQWVSSIVRLFANPKKNFGIDEGIARYLCKEESRIRMETRKNIGDKISKRDKTGVSASQFLGVLRMAKMSGGAAMWERCANVGSSYAVSQEISSKARAYRKANNDKWPNDAFLATKLAEIRKRKNKSARGGGGGGIKLGAPALIERMSKDIKDFKKRFKSLGAQLGCDVQIAAIARASERMMKAMAAHTLRQAIAEKAEKAA